MMKASQAPQQKAEKVDLQFLSKDIKTKTKSESLDRKHLLDNSYMKLGDNSQETNREKIFLPGKKRVMGSFRQTYAKTTTKSIYNMAPNQETPPSIGFTDTLHHLSRTRRRFTSGFCSSQGFHLPATPADVKESLLQ